MKRLFKFVAVPVLALLVLVGGLSFLLAEPNGYDPALHGDQPITLADGERVPLAGLMERLTEDAIAERSEAREEAIEEPDGTRPSTADALAAAREELDRVRPADLADDVIREVMRLAGDAYRNGRLAEATALLHSVPEGHDEYSRAQRFLGWEVLAKRGDRPRAGLSHLHRAIHADPLDGENWQDAARVFLRSVGVPYDPVHNSWDEG